MEKKKTDKKKISCDCITQLNKRLAADSGTAAANTRVDPVITLSGVTYAEIVASKINQKQRGKAVTIVATYCPFCGEKYPT